MDHVRAQSATYLCSVTILNTMAIVELSLVPGGEGECRNQLAARYYSGAGDGKPRKPSTYKMRQCCRCNGSGRCKNCSCVKAGKACTDCLPSKRQACSNRPTQPPQTSPPPPGISTTTSLTASTPLSPHIQDNMTTEQERCPVLMPTTEDPIHEGHPNICNLPTFNHMTNPIFEWGDLDATSFTGIRLQ